MNLPLCQIFSVFGIVAIAPLFAADHRRKLLQQNKSIAHAIRRQGGATARARKAASPFWQRLFRLDEAKRRLRLRCDDLELRDFDTRPAIARLAVGLEPGPDFLNLRWSVV